MKNPIAVSITLIAILLVCFMCGCELADPEVWPFALESQTDTVSPSPSPSAATPTDPLMQSIRDRGELIIVTCADYPPYEYIAADGDIAGIDVYVMEEIARSLGQDLLIINAASFDDVFVKLDAGEADLAISALRPTFERGGDYIVSETYFTDTQYVIARQSADTAASPTDVFTVFMLDDDELRFTVEELYSGCEVVCFDDLDALLYAFNAGEGDAVCGNAYVKQRLDGRAGLAVIETLDGAAQSSSALLRVKDGAELAMHVNAAIRDCLDRAKMDEMYLDYMRSVFE